LISGVELLSSGILGVSFVSTNGANYRMWYTTDLAADPVGWTETSSILGDGLQKMLTDTNAVLPLRIYKITAE
jgi:hypothetical protein